MIDPARYPLFDKLLFAVFVLAVPAVVGSSWTIFRDGDVSWHVAAGRWILAHGRVPDTDPFSHTMEGQPWVAFEWLSEVIYASAFNVASYAGLAATVTLALIAMYAILFDFLRRRAGPIAILVAFAVVNILTYPFLLARPHVLAWPLLAGWTAVLLKCRDSGQAPPWALALLMFLWANIHGSFAMGFIIAGAVALDALVAVRWDRNVLLRWLMFGLASLAAALLNLNGLDGLLHPLTVSGMKTLPAIEEWLPSNPRTSPFFYFILLGTLGILLFRRASFTVGELLLLLFSLALAFWHIRHQGVLAIIAALIVTPRLAGEARSQAAPLFKSTADWRIWTTAWITALLLIVGLRFAIPAQPREGFSNPRNLIAHVPSALKREPVLNEYSFGGPLILAGIRPYIDGRADMYGDAFFSDYLKIVDGDHARFDRAVRRYGISWTILQKDDRLVKVLDARPEWKRLYGDKIGVIHIHQPRMTGELSSAR
ncbi:hypothetical protein [Sphingomonas sp.]|uniref:hypothetical protein n=1 Tax=Sphingomonas sp. TaxID=28214 RepID=UPI0025CB804E|nr:hypothetical protein [Sphingomonas sp.]